MRKLVSPRAERLILGISGRIGSGKTTATEYLARTHGFKYLRYSQVLSEWLAASPTDKGRLQELGWEVMGGGMQQELNRRLIARIENKYSYAIDGLRHPIDYSCLKQHFPREFHLIFLQCPAEIRSKRLLHRFKTLREFERADSHPVEQQQISLENAAEFRIDNSGTESKLFANMESVLRTFEGEQP